MHLFEILKAGIMGLSKITGDSANWQVRSDCTAASVNAFVERIAYIVGNRRSAL